MRIAIAVLATLIALAPSASFAQDAARIAVGEEAWNKAGCPPCHGADGEGGTGGEFPAGPSLRKTRLDRGTLRETISCGLPGTEMPAWLDGAYTQRPCTASPPDRRPARRSSRCSAPRKSKRWSIISWRRSSGSSARPGREHEFDKRVTRS